MVPASFVLTGEANWAIDETNSATGTYSLQSGLISDSQTSCFSVNALGSSAVSFDWNVGSEAGWDYLRFYIDNLENDAISGTGAGWAHKTFVITTGDHEFKWCYGKDSSYSQSPDAGWVDNIAIY